MAPGPETLKITRAILALGMEAIFEVRTSILGISSGGENHQKVMKGLLLVGE
jgi:hypothetical protein